MTAQNKRIEVTLETTFESVDLAEDITSRVADATGFDKEDCYRISISVREGVINAVQWGNQQERSKKICLTFELAADRLVIRVLDQGAGFDLVDVPDALAEENLLKNSGRGILIIRSFMDELTVRRGCHGGAEVVMAKRYPAARRGEAPTGRGEAQPRPAEESEGGSSEF